MDYDRSIHHNPDAQAWAKFFIETTKDVDREVFGMEGFMIAWFSNAMMAMHDHLYKTEIVRLRNDAANEIERLRKALKKICHVTGSDMEAYDIAENALKGESDGTH